MLVPVLEVAWSRWRRIVKEWNERKVSLVNERIRMEDKKQIKSVEQTMDRIVLW